MKKNLTKTQKLHRNWKTASIVSKIGVYTCPFIPASIITAINAEEWFSENPWSIGIGFASLLISVLSSILAVASKDKLLKNKISVLYGLAGLFACFGISFMFLASISQNFGQMFLFTSFGLVGSATCNQLDEKLFSLKEKWYKEILNKAGIDKQDKVLERKKIEAINKAIKEAEEIGDIL
jgi:hypothetical protein